MIKGINKRKTSLKKYGISAKRYNELKAFCEQYQEWKEQLEELQPSAKTQLLDGMPHSNTNVTSDPTASMAMKRNELERKIAMVEETAKEACPDFADFIIKNICYGETVQYLISVVGLPLSVASFTDRKKYFYHILDRKKEK